MKITKFDLLLNCYVALYDGLKGIDHKLIHDLRESWSLSFKQIDELLASKQVTKSKLVPGLLQGLRELPALFRDMPNPEKARAMEIYADAVCGLSLD